MKPRKHRALAWIAVFKLAKVVGLLLAAATALRLLRPGALDGFVERLTQLPLAAGWHPMLRLIDWVAALSPHNLELIAAVACAYAALYATEGVGLWLEKRWAEYLTIVATASLIPFELWELSRGPNIAKFAALTINVAIVVYLWRLVKAERHGV